MDSNTKPIIDQLKEVYGHSEKRMMNVCEYCESQKRTSRDDLTPGEHMINGVMGLCGEAGECADIVKKFMYQGHDLDREHLIKELGDVAWYLQETAASIGSSLGEILYVNAEKLSKRYPNGFRVEESTDRKKGDI